MQQLPFRGFWRVVFAGVALAVLLVAWNRIALIPIANNHSHGDESAEEHVHTHDATFSHGHSHFGLQRDVTHSHPHVHEHEHTISDQDVDAGQWEQIGHVHRGDDAAIFLAKCQENDLQLTVSFAKYFDGEIVICDVDQKLLPGKILVGSRQVEELLFRRESSTYVAKLDEKLIAHPTISLAVSNLRIGTQDLEFTLPILRESETRTNTELVARQSAKASHPENSND